MAEIPNFDPAEMFTTTPDWIDFTDIPDDTAFYTRRGLPYSKDGRGVCQKRFDEDDIDDETAHDASVLDDWPYWICEETSGE